jgi:hypothetical protein
LGIEPHFELWRYFSVSLHKKRERSRDLLVPMGCASIHLQGRWFAEYMTLPLSKSDKGWHALWFYMKNDAIAPLPNFTGRLIEEVPSVWGWGPPKKEKRRHSNLLDAIALLKHRGLYGTGVIGAYHATRVAPLMAHALLLYRMTLSA